MKRTGFVLALAVCLLLGGCGLLPEEVQYENAPLIRPYQTPQWKNVYVQRGDICLSRTLTCTYVPVQTQTLSFAVEDARFDEVFVSVGEQVKKGQLLAQLNVSGINEQIADCQLKLQILQLKLEAVEENRQLAQEEQKLLWEDAGQLEAALEKLQEQFDLQRQPLLDELELTQMQLQACEKALSDRQLRAQIDGTVTYVRDVRQGSTVRAGEKMLVIEDASLSVFCADSRYWDRFIPGQLFDITVGQETYPAQVVSESQLGLPETDMTGAVYGLTYFQLLDPSVHLEDGDRGVVTLVLDQRQDALWVPESAVNQTGSGAVVYYQDENGLNTYKPVQVGLAAEGRIEILSGLTEGECILVE